MRLKLHVNIKNLYLLSRSSTDLELKNSYKSYCKSLTKSITEAKKTWYKKQLLPYNNKTKIMYNIIENEMNRNDKLDNIFFCFSSGNDESYDNQDISDSFNNFFLSTADNSTINIKNSNNHNKHTGTNPVYYLSQLFSDTLPDIKFRNTTNQETEKIINSLNTKFHMVMTIYQHKY
jgi:hypothetical protein